MLQDRSSNGEDRTWIAEHLIIAKRIAANLKRRYCWVDLDQLYSYALWGLTLAASAYRSETGVPFERFVRGKGMYVAIDAMREDRVLTRGNGHKRPMVLCCSDSDDGELGLLYKIADRRSSENLQAVDVRDQVGAMLGRLGDEDRQSLLMYYADGLTFKEIARVFNKSESAISFRHKNLLAKLRQMFSGGLGQTRGEIGHA